MKPRSRAASVESRPMPMLVGDVRRASWRPGRLLEVVGRQPVVVGADEHLEVVPGLARQATHLGALVWRQRPLPRRPWLAERPRDDRRGHPRRAGTASRRSTRAAGEAAIAGDREQRDERARRHLDQEHAQRRAAAQACRRRCHARRRLPFEQPAMRDREPRQREDDGPHHLPRVERQQHQRQQRLRRRGLHVLGDAAQEHAERMPVPRHGEQPGHRQQRAPIR